MRIAADELSRIQPYLPQYIARAGARLVRWGAVDLWTKGDSFLNWQPGIERGIGILEHHLHLAPHLTEFQAITIADGLPVEGDLAGIGFDQMHQQSRGR